MRFLRGLAVFALGIVAAVVYGSLTTAGAGVSNGEQSIATSDVPAPSPDLTAASMRAAVQNTPGRRELLAGASTREKLKTCFQDQLERYEKLVLAGKPLFSRGAMSHQLPTARAAAKNLRYNPHKVALSPNDVAMLDQLIDRQRKEVRLARETEALANARALAEKEKNNQFLFFPGAIPDAVWADITKPKTANDNYYALKPGPSGGRQVFVIESHLYPDVHRTSVATLKTLDDAEAAIRAFFERRRPR